MPPFRLIPSSALHISKPTHWLESRFHFAFADWYNGPQNFGVLRVLNDDLVTPDDGFGPHPHRDMEIISYIVSGQLAHEHRDSNGRGAKESLGRGSIQYMSAGTGVRHSEMNPSNHETVRFLQLWIVPDKRGHTPNYGSKKFSPGMRLNQALRVVSGQVGVDNFAPTGDDSIAIHQDANIYVGELDGAASVPFPLGVNRQAYFVCIEGGIQISASDAKDKVSLSERDAVEIQGPLSLSLTPTTSKAHWLMVEMAKS